MNDRPGAARVVLGATSSMSLAVLPTTLVAALAVQIRRDLDFGEVALGGTTAAFFGATALTSVLGGGVAERIGARRAMVLAAVGSAGSMLLAAALARSYGQLVALLVVAGVANGLAQPGGNLALVRGVRPDRQGSAFGIKQSAVPLAVLVSGATVPLLALRLGWRPALTVVALAGLLVVVVLARAGTPQARVEGGPDPRGARLPWPGLLLLAASCGLATSAALSLSTFAVDHAVGTGMAPASAGWLLSAGAVASILVRLVSGWSADRRWSTPLPTASVLLVAGAGGYAVLSAASDVPVLLVSAVVLAFAAGWGWPAVFALSVVRYAAQAPARATGVSQAGGALGGVLGPPAFGAVVAATTYPVAWGCAAAAALLAAAGMALAGRLHARRELTVGDAGLDRFG